VKRFFSNWVEAYAQYTASLEAPELFHKWTAISVLGGALGRKTWFEQHYYRWSPNFYIIMVAQPAICNKSTTARVGHNLLRQVGTARYGPNSLTWQALISWLSTNVEEVQLPDGTFLGMTQMNIVASELGSLVNPSDYEMIDVLTDLWDGDHTVWEKMTKTSGQETVPNPWINIIAGTTPGWLSGRIPRHMIDGGLFSRIIFVYADKKRSRVAYQDMGERSEEAIEFERKLVHDLEQISLLRGMYQLSSRAYDYGVKWYNEHQDRVEARDPLYQALGTYVSRKQTHLHKIAMALAAAKRDTLVLEESDLKEANDLLLLAEQDMFRVYMLASEDPIIAAANLLMETLIPYKRLPQDTLFRLVFSRMTFETYKKALVDITMARRAKIVQEGNAMYVVAEEERLPHAM